MKSSLSSIKPQAKGRAANASNRNSMLDQAWCCTPVIQPREILPGQKYGNSEATLGYLGQFKASLGCIVSPSEKQNRAKSKREQREVEIGKEKEEERARLSISCLQS